MVKVHSWRDYPSAKRRNRSSQRQRRSMPGGCGDQVVRRGGLRGF